MNGQKQGFRIPKKTAVLTFEGTDYDGAEVEVDLRVPLSVVIELQDLSREAGEKARETFQVFGERVLVTWNIEDDDGQPVPPTPEGMMQIPGDFAAMLIQGWTNLVTEVPAPLEQPSPSGSTSAGAMTGQLANSSRSLGS